MQVFESTIIKKFWPAEDKVKDSDDVIRQVVIQCEAELENNLQVGELFDSMVKGLVRVTFEDPESGESLSIPAITVKPFNVKQKKVKMSSGDEQDIVRTEYAALTMVSKLEDGALLLELLKLFNINVIMTIEEFSSGD